MTESAPVAPMALVAQLGSLCDALQLNATSEQLTVLARYVELLERWNGVYNLSAVRDRAGILSHHMADCLAVVPSLRQRFPDSGHCRLLDVGSGGGLPGVVIAALMPQVQVVCIDAVAKKAAFVQQAAGALPLPNLSAVHGRVERVSGPVSGFDVIACRAFSALSEFCKFTRTQLAAGGIWMAMKGVHPEAEIADLPDDIEMFHVEQLRVPGLDAQRCVVWMRVSAVATAPP